eukprot:COSAG01_NODE_60213_length_292_cov_0.517766_1_plen_49_part_10
MGACGPPRGLVKANKHTRGVAKDNFLSIAQILRRMQRWLTSVATIAATA